MSNKIPTFSIKELFESKDKYVIPIYQRNYAWGEGQVNQLIQDIYDFAFDAKKSKKNYYIGTLVVNEKHLNSELLYETIDGQQRLTTLNLVLVALHHTFSDKLSSKIDYELNLTFSSRKKSTETLSYICKKDFNGKYLVNKVYNVQIQNRYKDAVKILKKILVDDEAINTFYNYLSTKVQLVRVSVPEETDLNHYFEIMNNRGEQLEKHEILKAKMLEVLKEDKELTKAFSIIWDACSDMERYVQYGFSTNERDSIFSKNNWNELRCNSLECIANKLKNVNNAVQYNSLNEIISSSKKIEIIEKHDKDAPERFNAVVNFQNFLLHVLKIQTKAVDASSKTEQLKAVSLDDKRLLDFFEPYLKQDEEETKAFVTTFGFNLLKIKHLFDQYIVKREFKGDKEDWSLKKMKYYEGNKINYVNTFGDEGEDDNLNNEILMLLSMFHVSTPTMVYKHWLNGALFYLFTEDNHFTALNYRDYLIEIAESYLYGRYICKKGDEVDYYKIIYKEIRPKDLERELDLSRLDNGTSVENFVFNYLDYLLWKQGNNNSYKFSFNSSIEHHYPQNPPQNQPKLNDSDLHSFGNLSIMSSSKNSRFTNNMPEAKQNNFNLEKDSDSLKMQIMFSITKKKGWKEDQIREHRKEMINLLLQK